MEQAALIAGEVAMNLFYAALVLFYIVAMAFTVSWWQPMDPHDLATIGPPYPGRDAPV